MDPTTIVRLGQLRQQEIAEQAQQQGEIEYPLLMLAAKVWQSVKRSAAPVEKSVRQPSRQPAHQPAHQPARQSTTSICDEPCDGLSRSSA